MLWHLRGGCAGTNHRIPRCHQPDRARLQRLPRRTRARAVLAGLPRPAVLAVHADRCGGRVFRRAANRILPAGPAMRGAPPQPLCEFLSKQRLTSFTCCSCCLSAVPVRCVWIVVDGRSGDRAAPCGSRARGQVCTVLTDFPSSTRSDRQLRVPGLTACGGSATTSRRSPRHS